MEIVQRAYARVGFLGNPSDGYFGKTISFALENFYAEVKLIPAERISFVPHPIHDPGNFESLESLTIRTKTEGYYGGIRLLMSICSRFHTYCSDHRIHITPKKNFTLSYDTNIPRQAGLSGSSAIVCAALNCLLTYYSVETFVPMEDRPSLILSAETELGITAGLQDRVIQVYGGLVFMNFEKNSMEEFGRGLYTPLDPSLLPELYLVYASNPSDSGKVHSTVRKRWLEGDKFVQTAMEEIASLAEKGKSALENLDYSTLATIMDRNFDLRRQIFGDDALGDLNIKMVTVPKSVGASAKFTGSGGAVIVFCPEGKRQIELLQEACENEGFVCIKAKVAPSNVVS